MDKDEKGAGAGEQKGGSAAASPEVKITIDGVEKVMTQADVQQLVEKSASVEQKSQDVANVFKVVERYGTDPSTYLENSEAAFKVMDTLISKGVIDNQGQVIEKVVDVKPVEEKVDFRSRTDKVSEDKITQVVMKALAPTIEKLTGRLDELDTGVGSIYRKDLSREVKAKHPELNDEDVSRLFGMASADTSKDLWAHADVIVGIKTELKAEHEAEFAKTHGIDLEEYRNKLKEQSAEGGASSMFSGKKMQFERGRKGLRDKDAVSPMQAMIEHGKAQRQ